MFSKKASFQKCLKAHVWASFVPHHPHLCTGVPCPQYQRLTPPQATISLSVDMKDGELGFSVRCTRTPGEAEGLLPREMATH